MALCDKTVWTKPRGEISRRLTSILNEQESADTRRIGQINEQREESVRRRKVKRHVLINYLDNFSIFFVIGRLTMRWPGIRPRMLPIPRLFKQEYLFANLFFLRAIAHCGLWWGRYGSGRMVSGWWAGSDRRSSCCLVGRFSLLTLVPHGDGTMLIQRRFQRAFNASE